MTWMTLRAARPRLPDERRRAKLGSHDGAARHAVGGRRPGIIIKGLVDFVIIGVNRLFTKASCNPTGAALLPVIATSCLRFGAGMAAATVPPKVFANHEHEPAVPRAHLALRHRKPGRVRQHA